MLALDWTTHILIDKNPIAPWTFRRKGVVTIVESDGIDLDKTAP
jgi:hypothetical protein